ncbi:hypothetical protein OAM33_00800 [Candidatus Pelagibacter sp.]|jgi:hypothetical protein|nr:hypothetical protein [Candidatus Pelagibacter sp.]MDC1281902.1 hypothetical protein [Pelagibacteraceae bacterium]|tara:strand:- start:66 stop:497 length:432 start_codon:yes stop_codon:yes gene_type:complete
MKKINYLSFFILILITLTNSNRLSAEIIILSSCNNQKDGFLKNEYTLDLEKLLMTRNYVYNEKTFKKYRVTDLSVKKNNTLTKFIYREDNKILTDKVGYPQFYTQLVFKIDNPNIMIKTVINNEEAISLLSECKKIERFQKES